MRPDGLLQQSTAMVTHLVRPGADMGLPEMLASKHYTKGLDSRSPSCQHERLSQKCEPWDVPTLTAEHGHDVRPPLAVRRTGLEGSLLESLNMHG